MSASGPSGPLVLSSADFFYKISFFEALFQEITSECQTVCIKIWVQTICKVYQQMTLVGIEVSCLASHF